jgi:hypothetical protein
MSPWRSNQGEVREDRRKVLEESYREARQRIGALEGSVPPKSFFGDIGQARAVEELGKVVQELEATIQVQMTPRLLNYWQCPTLEGRDSTSTSTGKYHELSSLHGCNPDQWAHPTQLDPSRRASPFRPA